MQGISQTNLYECLDALQVNAYVGVDNGGVFHFTINGTTKIRTKDLEVNLKLKGEHLYENETSMYMLVSCGDLGILLKAKNGGLRRYAILDLGHPTAKEYRGVSDWTALLTHLTQDKWDNEWVLGDIEV